MNAGTNTTPPVSGTLAASGPVSDGVVDDAEAVAQPLHRGAGDEDRAFHRVGDGVAELPRDRREQAVDRRRVRSARGSRARTSRCRRCSWSCPARSTPGRTARPAGRRRCRSPAPRARRRASGIGDAEASARSAAPRAGTTRGTPNSVEQLVGPVAARRCRRASCGSRSTGRSRARRRRAAGEVPQDPRVDGAEREVGVGARRRPRASSHSSLVAEKYGSSTSPVRSRTSGSCPAARSSSQRAAVRRSCHTIARCRGRPVRAVPHHDRLALVGDADRGDGLAVASSAATTSASVVERRRARSRRRRARPSPAAGSAAGTRGTRSAGAVGVDRDRAHAGRAGVDREDDRPRQLSAGRRRACDRRRRRGRNSNTCVRRRRRSRSTCSSEAVAHVGRARGDRWRRRAARRRGASVTTTCPSATAHLAVVAAADSRDVPRRDRRVSDAPGRAHAGTTTDDAHTGGHAHRHAHRRGDCPGSTR